MTASVLQANGHSQNAGAGSWTVTLPSVSAGSALLLDVFINDGRTIISCTDSSGNTWVAVQAVTNGSLQIRQLRVYNAAASAGTLTVTITFDANTATVGASIREIGGVKTSSAIDGFTGQAQTTPGTGAGAVTSGNASSANQPALVLGTTANVSSTGSIASGSGFTTDYSVGFGWYGNQPCRLESKRVTATGNQAATFTASGGSDNFITMVVVMDEFTTATAAGLSQVSNQGGF